MLMDTINETSSNHVLDTIHQFREPAALYKLNQDNIYEVVFVTEAFARLMECSIEEAQSLMANKGYFTTTHPDDRIFVRRMLRRHVNEEGWPNLIIRKNTAKGRMLWCDVRYSFFIENDEQYLYATYFDITTLKEYETRLNSAYSNLGDSFYRTNDSTLSLLRVNLSEDVIEDIRGRELYGFDSLVSPYSIVLQKRAECCEIPSERESYLELFDPDELIVGYFMDRVKTSKVFYSKRPDGTARYIQVTAQTTRHPLTGDIIAFISEEEANESKVRTILLDRVLVRQFDMVAWLSEEKYGVVIGDAESINHGSIFPTTRTGVYEDYLHSQVEPVLHGSEKERHEMLNALSLETIHEKIAQQQPYVVNIVIKMEDELYYKRFDFYTINPNSRFYIVLKSDTSDLQREQIRINTQLKLTLKEAQQASVAKTAFLSRMSHEIRTPMNAIIGLGNLALREPNLSENLITYFTKINSSAQYLLSLINDILDMSRIESGRMVLKKEEFAFSTFLDLVNTMADGQCRDKGLEYACRVEGHLNDFYIGDDTKLRQVLINILGNSIKFTPSGGRVSLTVSCVSSFENQSILRFAIEDTGIGMEQEFLPKLFEAFSQEDSSNTTKYGGSGLGLAITKNIVTLMNGEITVTSQKGVGSTFTVTVTLQDSPKSRSIHDYELNAKDLRVLIIDDEEVECRHTKTVLESAGIAAETCLSEEEALKIIAMHHARYEDFNIILVDLRMPTHDGIYVTRSIREVLGASAIILLTAYTWSDREEEAKEAGVDSFISKPVFVSQVLQEVKRVFTEREKEKKEISPEDCDLNGRRILLAEDVEINAEIMTQLLEIMGIQVEHAENGQRAIDMFREHDSGYYDAILMDVRMPVIDGLSATKTIRSLEHGDSKDIPIIAMTANAFDEDVQLSLQAGMNAHLTKPVEAEHLTRTLQSLIAIYDAKRRT